ncbi:MAG TPA: methyltransferase domain-containing protein [Pseudomonadales bacterium]
MTVSFWLLARPCWAKYRIIATPILSSECNGLKSNLMAQLTVERLSHDGKGIARSAGKVGFIPGALAGERVEATLVRRHRRYDEYRLLRVLDAASDRVEPPCPLVGRCGGCDLQHLAGPAQLEHKTRVLLDQISRQAGLEPAELLPPLTADPFGYRRRARLAVHVPRRGESLTLGLRAAGDKEIVPIDRCPVLVPELAGLPGRLQQQLAELTRPAVLGHVELSLAETEAGPSLPVIYLRMTASPAAADRLVLRDFAEAQGAYLAARAGDGRLEYLYRPRAEEPAYRLPEFGLNIGYVPGEFVQGNPAINRRLVRQVVDWVAELEARNVLDAFCGVGNFSLALARRGLQVTGLEVAAEAVTVARQNAARNALPDLRFATRNLLTDPGCIDAMDFDTVVLDPPRDGARALVAALASRGVDGLVYVSCAPGTFARDAAILAEAGYTLGKLRLVDMFPQTSHIELAAEFRRGRRGTRS